MRRVRKIADKIRERLLAKYPHLSQKEYLEKIYGYKKKYGFDDSEMQSIINLVLLKKDFLTKDQIEPDENTALNTVKKYQFPHCKIISNSQGYTYLTAVPMYPIVFLFVVQLDQWTTELDLQKDLLKFY